MAWTNSQKYLAEFLGTFALLLFGGGAAVTSIGVGDPLSRVVLVSMAFGLTVLGAAYALGDISGGHFNPAVTLSMAFSKRMPMADVVPYLVAQVVGGLAGILVIIAIVHGGPSLVWSTDQASGFGSQSYAETANSAPGGFALGSVFLIELALTFVFVLVIQLVTRPENGTKNLAPAAIGLTLLVTNLVAIPVDGASMNPVRSLSPAIATAISGSGAPSWPIGQVWIFLVAPILGGILAAIVEMWLRPKP